MQAIQYCKVLIIREFSRISPLNFLGNGIHGLITCISRDLTRANVANSGLYNTFRVCTGSLMRGRIELIPCVSNSLMLAMEWYFDHGILLSTLFASITPSSHFISSIFATSSSLIIPSYLTSNVHTGEKRGVLLKKGNSLISVCFEGKLGIFFTTG